MSSMAIWHTEVVCEDRISDADVPSNALVEASIREYSVRGRKMLFPVQALVFELLKCWILAYLECFS